MKASTQTLILAIEIGARDIAPGYARRWAQRLAAAEIRELLQRAAK